jgi:hypothetical protein
MKEKVAICLIVKDEPEMIPEFIDYYLKLGADTIIIYDNESVEPVTSENSNVIIKYWKTTPIYNQNQRLAFLDCANTFKEQFKWIGFFDTDEYLILKKHQTIKEFLADYDYAQGIGINWLCFGSSYIQEHKSHKDYYMHIDPNNWENSHIKCFIKPEFLLKMPNDPHYLNVYTVNTKGVTINAPWDKHDRDIAYIKHCFTRTKDNFIKKSQRSHIDGIPKKVRTPEMWEQNEKIYNEYQEEKFIWMF